MSSLILRRADVTDVPGIQSLITSSGQEKLLSRRFGESALDVQRTLDTSHLSIVGTVAKKVVGFVAVTTAPPLHFDVSNLSFKEDDNNHPGYSAEEYAEIDNKVPLSLTRWDKWIRQSFEMSDVTLHNTGFLTLFTAENEIQVEFLDKSLEFIFRILPKVNYVGYFLPVSMVLFQPFSSARWEPPVTQQQDALTLTNDQEAASRRNIKKYRRKPIQRYFSEITCKNEAASFSFHAVQRNEILPLLSVRKARVEDCDDLIPMLQRRNLLKVDHPDYFLAELVESKSPAVRNLVAEANGVVVGFMSINRAVDQDQLAQRYRLEKFDNLRRDGGSDPEPNAFCVTMICLEEEYALQGTQLLKHAFDLFPGREYCLITVPSDAPFLPLLYHFSTFDPVPSYPDGHTLYVANRYGFDKGSELEVRKGTEQDRDGIAHLLQGVSVTSHAVSIFKECLQPVLKHSYRTYVCEHDGQIVGLIQLESCHDAQTYSDQFDIEFFVDVKSPSSSFQGQTVLLRHVIFNPFFERCARTALGEVIRQEGLSFLLYPVDEIGREDLSTQDMALREFFPLKSRRMIEFPERLRDGFVVPKPMPYQIQILPKSLLHEPRIDVNVKIVVLGGSNVGVAFLEKLIYTPHLRFANLVLVSEDGEPSLDDKLLTNDLTYAAVELKQLAIAYYVKVITGSANALNREKKKLILNTGETISYEYLIMVPGTQYRVSSSLDGAFEAVDGVVSVTKNVMKNLKEIVNKYVGGNDSKVILYGRSLQAYVTLKHLLSVGLPKERLVFVDPRGPKDISCFNNIAIEELLDKTLSQAAVTRITGSRISRWFEDSSRPSSRQLSSIVLKDMKTNAKTTIENTGLFLYADERSVSPDTFRLFNDACLVFDGRLVINRDFQTDDPSIFGAGSVTKYASKYKTDWSHSHFDAKEIGCSLANYLLPRMDPTGVIDEPEAELPVSEDEPEAIRVFNDSKKVEALLPGDLYYFHYDRPRLPIMTLEERRKRPNYGRDLVLKAQPGEYFRIHVDPVGYIRSLTYLGTRRISTLNYATLYGLHEKYLNRLVARFDEGVIQDFIPFLKETWALPIYYDRFKLFVKSLKSHAMSQDTNEMKEIINVLDQNAKTGKKITEREMKVLYHKFDSSPKRHQLDCFVFEYLLQTDVFKCYP